MATIDLTGPFTGGPAGHGLSGWLRGGWLAWQRRRRQRRALEALSRLGPYLLRDAGIDPDEIEATLGGGWDRTDPVGLRLLLPRGTHL